MKNELKLIDKQNYDKIIEMNIKYNINNSKNTFILVNKLGSFDIDK